MVKRRRERKKAGLLRITGPSSNVKKH